jgi:hypothetical protein
MKFSKTVQLLGLELGLVLPVPATVQPMQAPPVVLRVSLFDDAGVGATTLREAEREASQYRGDLAPMPSEYFGTDFPRPLRGGFISGTSSTSSRCAPAHRKDIYGRHVVPFGRR